MIWVKVIIYYLFTNAVFLPASLFVVLLLHVAFKIFPRSLWQLQKVCWMFLPILLWGFFWGYTLTLPPAFETSWFPWVLPDQWRGVFLVPLAFIPLSFIPILLYLVARRRLKNQVSPVTDPLLLSRFNQIKSQLDLQYGNLFHYERSSCVGGWDDAVTINENRHSKYREVELTHELIHLKNKDPVSIMLMLLPAIALPVLLPAIFICLAKFKAAAEYYCDQLVAEVYGAGHVANALASYLSGRTSQGFLSFVKDPTPEKRIETLLSHDSKNYPKNQKNLIFAGIFIAILIFTVGFTTANSSNAYLNHILLVLLIINLFVHIHERRWP